LIRRFKKKQENRKFYRVNERIFAHTLRVLDSNGRQIRVMSKFDALKLAQEQAVDLVEIAPMAKPPVAKLIDFKKFLYQEAKKKKEEKKKAKVSETKEIRLGPFMNDHDVAIMIKKGRTFLENNDKLRLVVKFIGREITHPEFGQRIIQKAITGFSDVSKIEREPHFEGRSLIAILSPEKSSKGKSKDKKYEEKNQKISSKAV